MGYFGIKDSLDNGHGAQAIFRAVLTLPSIVGSASVLKDIKLPKFGSKSGSKAVETPIFTGKSKPWDSGATPNSIYEQLNPDGTVKSRAFYDENGRQFSRQDFDILILIKRQNSTINHMNIIITITRMVNRLEKLMDHFQTDIQICRQDRSEKV